MATIMQPLIAPQPAPTTPPVVATKVSDQSIHQQSEGSTVTEPTNLYGLK
jgi:hypothetical protein